MDSVLNRETAELLRSADAGSIPVTVGLDAFVDEIVRVVARRSSRTEYVPVKTITDLGARVAGAAGQSMNFELVVERVKIGGNGPIMANAIAALGAEVTCIGPLGDNGLHPAFAEMAARARCISLGAPGHTDALEFDDGKLMLGKLEPLDDVNWARLEERVGAAEWRRLLTQSRLVALVNWTMIPHMSDIWAEALAVIESEPGEGLFFFDLCDPEKHDDATLAAACRLLGRFGPHRRTILGLNEKEAFRVGRSLGYTGAQSSRDDIKAVAILISSELPIESVVVHPRAYAVAAASGKITADVDGPFTEFPRISTGAGDHFNAGYCFAKLLGLADANAVTAAVGTSGYYVRNASSPSLAELAEFLAEYRAG